MSKNTIPSPTARKARLAVNIFFFTNGMLFSSLVPHFPGIKSDLALSNAAYGLAIAAVPAGAIIAGPAAGFVIRKLGSAATSLLFTAIAACALLLVPFTGSVGALMAAFFLIGVCDSIADVGQNAHGLRVQREYGRSIINSFHAIWSIGAVAGGSLAALAISLGVPRAAHIALAAVITVGGAFLAYTWRLPGADTPATDSQFSDDSVASHAPVAVGESSVSAAQRASVARTVVILAALSLIAIAGALIEDAGSTWAAVYLGDSLGAVASIASLGYIFLVGAQFVGRMLGDRFVDRFGQRIVARAGGALICVGMGLALAFPSVALTIVGFALAGFGSATLVPAAYQGADEIPGLKPGTGLTIVSWLLRLGFLLSPPIVGLVADASSLRLGLLVLPVAGLLVIVCSGVLSNTRATARVDSAESRD